MTTQDASVAQFSIDGHVCFLLPEGVPTQSRIVGSVTLGKRRYAICSDHSDRTHVRPSDVLTSRELQIAVLIAQGFDDKSIGRRLGISPFTVGTHLSRTYSKLGVNSRSALAALIAGTVALHRRSPERIGDAGQVLPQA
jgi:DNA-binding CsgD family transcriptional regulator